jgi:nitroreductase
VELIDTLRTTGAVRDFLDEAVPDDVVATILDTARFAPSGGNRQGWRVVLVKDADTRRRLRDLYLVGWYEYLAMHLAGLTPWAPVTDRAAEQQALATAPALAERAAAAPTPGFPEALDRVPVLLAIFADLKALAAVDRDLDRYTFAGGASVYPFAWNILLAARAHELAGVVTTMPIRQEAAVRALVGAPDDHALAAVVALGHPVRQPRRLTRAAVPAFTTVDRFDGPSLPAPGPG